MKNSKREILRKKLGVLYEFTKDDGMFMVHIGDNMGYLIPVTDFVLDIIDSEIFKARKEGRKVGLNIFYEGITQNVGGKNGKKNARRYYSEKIDDFLNEIKRKVKQEVLEDLFSWTCIPVKGKFIDIESNSRFQKKILSELSKLVK